MEERDVFEMWSARKGIFLSSLMAVVRLNRDWGRPRYQLLDDEMDVKPLID